METNCLDEVLPNKFEYVILESDFESVEKFTCTLRVKILNGNDLLEWLRVFEKLTNTNWNARSSKVDSVKFFVARDFVCHHSSFNKQTVEKDSDKRKNKTCGAKLSIRIKWNTKDVRYKDKYIRDGYFGIIRINFLHSHAVNSAESLRWLRRGPEIKTKFLELFDIGLTPAEAIRFHENEISKCCPQEMANRRVNPPKKWVYDFHYKWLLKKNKKDSVLVSAKSNDQNMQGNWECIIKDEIMSKCNVLNELIDDDHNSVCSSTSSMQAEELNFMISNVSETQVDEPTNINNSKSTSQKNIVHLIYVKEDCTVDKDKKYCKILSKDEDRTNIASSIQTEDGCSSIVANTSGAEKKDETTETSCNTSSAKMGMEPTIISDNTSGAQIELLSNFQIELDRIVGLLKFNINDKYLYNLAEKYIQKLKRVNTSEQLHSFLVKSILSFHSEFDHQTEKQTSLKQKRKRTESSLATKVNRQSISPYHKKFQNWTNCKGV